MCRLFEKHHPERFTFLSARLAVPKEWALSENG